MISSCFRNSRKTAPATEAPRFQGASGLTKTGQGGTAPVVLCLSGNYFTPVLKRECGGAGALHHGCAAPKSPAAVWQCHVNMDQKPLEIVSGTTVLKPEAGGRVQGKQNLALVPRKGGAQKSSSQTHWPKKKSSNMSQTWTAVPCLACEMIDEQDSTDYHRRMNEWMNAQAHLIWIETCKHIYSNRSVVSLACDMGSQHRWSFNVWLSAWGFPCFEPQAHVQSLNSYVLNNWCDLIGFVRAMK